MLGTLNLYVAFTTRSRNLTFSIVKLVYNSFARLPFSKFFPLMNHLQAPNIFNSPSRTTTSSKHLAFPDKPPNLRSNSQLPIHPQRNRIPKYYFHPTPLLNKSNIPLNPLAQIIPKSPPTILPHLITHLRNLMQTDFLISLRLALAFCVFLA